MLEIFVLGDSNLVYQTLMAVAAFFNNDTFTGMLKTAMMLGIVLAGMRHAFTDGPFHAGESVLKQQLGPWSIVMPVFIGYMATVPQASYMVVDAIDGTTYEVDNVPVIVGFPVAVTSRIGREISSAFETAFQPAEGARMTKVGFMDSLYTLDKLRKMDLSKMRTADNRNYDMGKTLMRYYQDCVKVDMESIEPPPKITAAKLRSSSDIIGELRFANFANLSTVTYLSPTTSGTNDDPSADEIAKTCGEAFDLISTTFQSADLVNSVSDFVKSAVLKKSGYAGSAQDIIAQSMAGLGQSATDSSRVLANMLVSKTLAKAEIQHAIAEDSGSGAGWAMVLGDAQRISSAKFITERSLFEKYARPFMAFIEVLSLAVAPLMPFILLTGSTKALFGWLTMTIWIAMWSPILTLVNFYVITKCKGDIDALLLSQNVGGITTSDYLTSMEGLSYLLGTANEWLAIGGMLSAATPAISMAVLTGGMTGMSNLAGAMGKADGVNTSGVAPTSFDAGPMVRGQPGSELSAMGGSAAPGFESRIAQHSLKGSASSGLSKKLSEGQNAMAEHNQAFSAGESEALKGEAGFKASQAHGQAGSRSTERGMAMMNTAVETASKGMNLSETSRNAINDALMTSASGGVGVDAGFVRARIDTALQHSNLSAEEKTAASNAGYQAAQSLQSQGFAREAVRGEDFQRAQTEYGQSMGHAIGGDLGSKFVASAKAVQRSGAEIGQLDQLQNSVGTDESKSAATAVGAMSQEQKQMLEGFAKNDQKLAQEANQAAQAFKNMKGHQSANQLRQMGIVEALFARLGKGDGDAASKLGQVMQGVYTSNPGMSNLPTGPNQAEVAAGLSNAQQHLAGNAGVVNDVNAAVANAPKFSGDPLKDMTKNKGLKDPGSVGKPNRQPSGSKVSNPPVVGKPAGGQPSGNGPQTPSVAQPASIPQVAASGGPAANTPAVSSGPAVGGGSPGATPKAKSGGKGPAATTPAANTPATTTPAANTPAANTPLSGAPSTGGGSGVGTPPAANTPGVKSASGAGNPPTATTATVGSGGGTGGPEATTPKIKAGGGFGNHQGAFATPMGGDARGAAGKSFGDRAKAAYDSMTPGQQQAITAAVESGANIGGSEFNVPNIGGGEGEGTDGIAPTNVQVGSASSPSAKTPEAHAAGSGGEPPVSATGVIPPTVDAKAANKIETGGKGGKGGGGKPAAKKPSAPNVHAKSETKLESGSGGGKPSSEGSPKSESGGGGDKPSVTTSESTSADPSSKAGGGQAPGSKGGRGVSIFAGMSSTGVTAEQLMPFMSKSSGSPAAKKDEQPSGGGGSQGGSQGGDGGKPAGAQAGGGGQQPANKSEKKSAPAGGGQPAQGGSPASGAAPAGGGQPAQGGSSGLVPGGGFKPSGGGKMPKGMSNSIPLGSFDMSGGAPAPAPIPQAQSEGLKEQFAQSASEISANHAQKVADKPKNIGQQAGEHYGQVVETGKEAGKAALSWANENKGTIALVAAGLLAGGAGALIVRGMVQEAGATILANASQQQFGRILAGHLARGDTKSAAKLVESLGGDKAFKFMQWMEKSMGKGGAKTMERGAAREAEKFASKATNPSRHYTETPSAKPSGGGGAKGGGGGAKGGGGEDPMASFNAREELDRLFGSGS